MTDSDRAGHGDATGFEDGYPVIESVLPEGVRIGPSPYGRGLYATRAYPKGSVVYRSSSRLISFPGGVSDRSVLRVVTPDGCLVDSYVIDNRVHSVQHVSDPACREVFGFDGFMNHSCEPSTWCAETGGTRYEVRAFRDIAVGEELTCDYALFDYTCDGHEIDVCGCGSASCLGSMTGFANLSRQEQVRRLHMCDEAVLVRFLSEAVPPVVILESALPAGIGIVGDAGDVGVSLVALRDFKAGEIVFANTARALPKGVAATYVFKIDGHDPYYLVNPDEHFVERSEYLEFHGFDCLMRHSCEPNLEQRYTSQLDYLVTAVRDIVTGEAITR